MHAEAQVVGHLEVLERVASAASCAASGDDGPNTFGMSKFAFSSTMFAVETSPTSHPARVHGTHGAGVVASVVVFAAGTLGE